MRKSEVVLTLALLGSAATAAWLWHSLETERQRSSELVARNAALERRLHAFETRPASTPEATAAIAARPEPAAKTEALSISATSPRTSTSNDAEIRDHLRAEAQRQREMLRDPAYRKSQIDAARRRFARPRADAIRVVGMTPEQADRVIELWVERNMRYTELFQGVPGERPDDDAQAGLKRAGDAEQAELRALLGQEKYEAWGRYLASGEERAEVGQLRDQLASGVETLQERQADALVDTIYSERQRRAQEYEEYVKSMGITDRNVVSAQDRQRWLDLEKDANQRIHAAAAGMLSATQLASLDEMLAARLVPVETALRLQRQGLKQ